MTRRLLFIALAIASLAFPAWATDDDGPPISITSPDLDSTFVLGTIKSRSLYWNNKSKLMIVRVTFTDAEANLGQPNDDTHEYRLPGITFDAAKGIFTATTKKGEVIPVAHFKKVLFIKSIEVTPNAAVRIIHPRGGTVSVILEAISPNDPAMHPAPTDPDAEHKVNIDGIMR